MKWRKSSYSGANGQCVEWKRACANNACVEVGQSVPCAGGDCVVAASCKCGSDVLVRDSKDPDGPILHFDHQEWTSFVDGVKAGKFDFKIL